ncbi:unnamed protein product, partial [Symbiodinium natans]
MSADNAATLAQFTAMWASLDEPARQRLLSSVPAVPSPAPSAVPATPTADSAQEAHTAVENPAKPSTKAPPEIVTGAAPPSQPMLSAQQAQELQDLKAAALARRQATLDSAAQSAHAPSSANSSAQPSALSGDAGSQDRRHDLIFLDPLMECIWTPGHLRTATSAPAQTCLRRPEPRGARSPQMPPNVKDSHADCLDEATATCAAYYAGPPIAPDPDLEEQTTATPPAQDAPAAPNPKANPPQLGPTLSCLDMDNYRIERDARGRILIHQCDYDVLMAHAYRGLPSTRFMMDNESFTVVPGPYPFGTPPTVPPPTREPAPAQSTPDEPAPAQQDGDANRPGGSIFPDPGRTDRSCKPRAQADRLQPTPRLLIGQPPDRRYRGCTILPSMCLPDTFRLAQHEAQVCYMDHNNRLRCARPCNTPPFCPYGLVCAQQMPSPDEVHERHQCSRCHEFDKHRESVWGHFLSPAHEHRAPASPGSFLPRWPTCLLLGFSPARPQGSWVTSTLATPSSAFFPRHASNAEDKSFASGIMSAQPMPRSDFVIKNIKENEHAQFDEVAKMYRRLSNMNPGAAGSAFELLVHLFWQEATARKDTVPLTLRKPGTDDLHWLVSCAQFESRPRSIEEHEGMEIGNDIVGYFTPDSPRYPVLDSILRFKLADKTEVLAIQISTAIQHKHGLLEPLPKLLQLLPALPMATKPQLALWDFPPDKPCKWNPEESAHWELLHVGCETFDERMRGRLRVAFLLASILQVVPRRLGLAPSMH